MTLRVAYLVNLYPAVSHTFIQREIHALERQGVTVHRYALRGWDAVLADERDKAERDRTRYVLAGGALALAGALLRSLVREPMRCLRAWRLAARMARTSDRPRPVHWIYLAEACLVGEWMARDRIEHLHAHFATNPAEIAMLAHVLSGRPYSFTAHGSDIMDRPAQVGLPLTVGHAAFVAAVCSFGRCQLFKWLPPSLWERVQVVGCGLERGYGDDALAPRVQSRRLVCVGRLSAEKGQLLLLQAVRLLHQQGEDFELVLAGDGPMRAQLEAFMSDHGLANRVRITGWLDAAGIRHELREARGLVVPSLSEGLPVVIMEAMAHQRPVVAPYMAGIPELVTHRETGWLYPASDVAAMAEAMKMCLHADAGTLESVGRAARERVWQHHDVDNLARQLKRLMEGAATP